MHPRQMFLQDSEGSEPVSALGLGAASEGVLGLCEVSPGISGSVWREGSLFHSEDHSLTTIPCDPGLCPGGMTGTYTWGNQNLELHNLKHQVRLAQSRVSEVRLELSHARRSCFLSHYDLSPFLLLVSKMLLGEMLQTMQHYLLY